jgi:exopolyphosphatase/guanosine-5'-triphosphate,3'-diphosphate pyrophosphatase
VKNLSLKVFDQLSAIHGMEAAERRWLEAAALLHDIAKNINEKKHHKIGRDMILNSDRFPFDENEKMCIALIVRYHKGPRPYKRHKYFRDLNPQEQNMIRKLSAILRFADALDQKDKDPVESIQCTISKNCISTHLVTKNSIRITQIARKSSFIEKMFNKRMQIVIDPIKTQHPQIMTLNSGF